MEFGKPENFLKKNFLDRLSCIFAKHRVLDYRYFGIPNRKRNNALQQPIDVVNFVRSYIEPEPHFAGQKI